MSESLAPNATKEPFVPEILSGEQINYALGMIEDRHKLRNTPFRIVWPWLEYVCCCCMKARKKRFDFALKRSLRKKLGLPVSNSDKRLEEDPYLMVGYGLNSYLQIMIQLLIMMGIISVIMLPSLLELSSFNALS